MIEAGIFFTETSDYFSEILCQSKDYAYGIMTGLFAWIGLTALSWTYFIIEISSSTKCMPTAADDFREYITYMTIDSNCNIIILIIIILIIWYIITLRVHDISSYLKNITFIRFLKYVLLNQCLTTMEY